MAPAEGAALERLVAVAESHGAEVVSVLAEVRRLVVEATETTAAALVVEPSVGAVRPSISLEPSLTESSVVVGADVATEAGFTGAGKVVVVVDSGIDASHPALAGAVVHEACFLQGTGGVCPVSGTPASVGPGSAAPCSFSASACTHGTHVAGIVASRDATRPGVAAGASLIAIRVLAEDGSIETAGVLAALDHVAALAPTHDIVAVNLSFGGPGDPCLDPDLDAALAVLADLGIAVIGASGNTAGDAIAFPACLAGVVAVGSAEPEGDARVVSDFTQFDGDLRFVAPGRSIESSVTSAADSSGFARYTGTSMSAPHVAGALAVLAEARPDWSVERLLALLRSTGAPIPRLEDGEVRGVHPEPRLAAALAFEPFTDAEPGYSQAAIDWAAATGVAEGIGDGAYGPDRWSTRAEAATMIWRFHGSPAPAGPAPFTDVRAGAFYADAVAWLYETGITTGTTPTTFSPDSLGNRAQLATLLWRAAGAPLGPSPGFADVELDRYFTDAVGWMVRWGLTTGTSDTTFSPFSITTREHAVTFLWRLATTRDAWHAAVSTPDTVLS